MIIKLSHKQTHVQNLSVQFSSRWYLCAQESPYALHPVSQMFPQHCFEMVPMFQDLASKMLIEIHPPPPPNLSSIYLPYISTNINPFSSQAMKPIPWWNIWNRMRPRALVQNQDTSELISAQNTQVHQRPESHTITLTWHTCKSKDINKADVPPVEFMYLVFTYMPSESYRRWLGSLLLYLHYVFRVLINSLVHCIPWWVWCGAHCSQRGVVSMRLHGRCCSAKEQSDNIQYITVYMLLSTHPWHRCWCGRVWRTGGSNPRTK